MHYHCFDIYLSSINPPPPFSSQSLFVRSDPSLSVFIQLTHISVTNNCSNIIGDSKNCHWYVGHDINPQHALYLYLILYDPHVSEGVIHPPRKRIAVSFLYYSSLLPATIGIHTKVFSPYMATFSYMSNNLKFFCIRLRKHSSTLLLSTMCVKFLYYSSYLYSIWITTIATIPILLLSNRNIFFNFNKLRNSVYSTSATCEAPPAVNLSAFACWWRWHLKPAQGTDPESTQRERNRIWRNREEPWPDPPLAGRTWSDWAPSSTCPCSSSSIAAKWYSRGMPSQLNIAGPPGIGIG